MFTLLSAGMELDEYVNKGIKVHSFINLLTEEKKEPSIKC